LPAGYGCAEDRYGAHVRELETKTLVVLRGSGNPDAIIRASISLVAEDEDDFVFHIYCETAEHRTSDGIHTIQSI
jgi:hypothetical protein